MRALWMLTFLIGMGCSPEDAVDWEGVPAELAWDTLEGDENPPPGRRAVVLTSGPIVHSDPLTVTITGLNAGETTHLLRSGGTGAGACPPVLGGALCLDLVGTVSMIGNATADASGVATFTLNIPSFVEGNTMAMQAVAVRGAGGVDSVKSNPVSGVVQAPGGVLGAGDLLAGDLVITEVMQNPNAVADTAGEWFELTNNAGADVDLDGVVITDLGADLHTIAGPLVVPAGGYVVLARNGDIAVNGGVTADYVYTGVTLGNGADELEVSFNSLLIDSVQWDGGAQWPDPTGATMQLSDDLVDAISNDAGASWCDATAVYGAGDLGTPGASNGDCAAPPPETCFDGIVNQDETGIDCGGVCPSCTNDPPSYLTDDDFETGDLTVFPYSFTGLDAWTIESDAANCFEGSHCLRTSPNHQLDETSTLEVALSVRDNDQISFWASTNTEPGEHFFRFYIDGVLQLELSGQTAFTEYTFPVSGTGANGPDRTFTWEYSRSTFMDLTHVPWNEVWVDAIDFPEWNTQPGVPALSAPGNHSLVDSSPVFAWSASDPDFDTVTYEFQYDDDPTFPTPSTTGETFATSDQPSLADGVWYWRVRSKDNSDYRWSSWSETRSVEVDGAAEYPLVWQQQVTGQFDMNDNLMIDTTSDLMQSITSSYDVWTGWQYANYAVHAFSMAPMVDATPATVTVEVEGDFDSASVEYVNLISIDGDTLETNWGPGTCNVVHSNSYAVADVQPYAADGTIDVVVDFTADVNNACTNNDRSRVNLSWDASEAMVTTQPIAHADLGGSLWDRVQWASTGTVTVQILDENLALIPDADLPGNSAGFSGGTVHLFDVDPATYPVIHLQAALGVASSIDSWRVVANDAFEWTFEYPGDHEGWVALDDGATPFSDVFDGLLVVESYTGGTNPRVELWFPQPIDATRFTTLEARVRTSNNYINDDPTLYWASNFGAFDTRRSIEQTQTYLFSFQDLVFDLTVVPTLPDEPWQGMVEAIRLDPVVAFEDQVGLPSDGWFEIESISLY